jgi:DNA processing protein
MKFTENAINIIAVSTYKGIGKAWITKNFRSPMSELEIVELLNRSSKLDFKLTVKEFVNQKELIKEKLIKLERFIDGVVALGDDDFPLPKGIVKDSEKPVCIFYRGDLSLLNGNSKNVAVIGLLNPDEEIEKIEREFVDELVKNGVVIVSGLALGCDTIAHKQALESNGKTVAILPSTLSDILPKKNYKLAQEIVARGGLLISEYLTIHKSNMELRGRYQERDRLQALYSDLIVLVASYSKDDIGDSGSRLAMRYAKEYSIPRAVIYNERRFYNNPKYNLNRQIIAEDPNVYIVDCENISSSVSKILKIKPTIKYQVSQRKIV